MKVMSYQAHNVQKVSDINLDLAGHHLYLVGGKNGQGKTSALNALLMALCGRNGMQKYPEVALKEGESEGWVKVQLSGESEMHDDTGFTVELLLKRKRDKSVIEEFRILDSSGEEAPEPRTLLKKLFKMRAFDPLSFERLDKKQQKEILQKLLGLDFAAQDAESAKAYAERTVVNREVAKARTQVESLTVHADAPAEEVTTTSLLAKLEAAQAVNKENSEHRKHTAACESQLTQTRNQIAEITVQITNLEGKRESLRAIAKKWVEDHEAAQLAESHLMDIDEAPIRTAMKDLDATNAKVRENKKAAEAHVALKAKQAESERLTKVMEDIAAAQKKAIAEAKFPVEGMSFDEEGVLFNGLPFEQANKAARVLASVDVGMALNPSLRLLVCECGGDLDTETLAALETKLRENDFQMLVELVTRTEADENLCQVVIKDGKVR